MMIKEVIRTATYELRTPDWGDPKRRASLYLVQRDGYSSIFFTLECIGFPQSFVYDDWGAVSSEFSPIANSRIQYDGRY